jgi:type VI secretion system secreted protein Hcp
MMPIYMCYDNLAIPGDATAAGHEFWIELSGLQWGVGRSISSPVGGSADREATAPTVGGISVTKPNDKASPKLFNEALQGEGKTVQIDFCKTDKGKLETYMSLKLSNCMISDNTVASSGDRPQESLTLSFTKFEFRNLAMKAAGDPADPETLTYDLATASIC